MNNMEIKVNVKGIPEVIEQLQKADDKINDLQSKIDKANKILDKYAKTEVEDYNKIIKFYKELRDILKENK